MEKRLIKCILASIVLAAVNFLWQAITARNWSLAADRSYFQAVAIFLFAF